jgi:hypothetical protein
MDRLSANDERLREILLGQEALLRDVEAVLREEQDKDDVLRAAVLSSQGEGINRIHRMDPDRVFTIDGIRSLCVRYRLRFLDAGRYKGTLPPSALYHLRALESRAEAPLKGFKIMAPASRFKLCDSNADPLLFVPIGPKHFYLVHKWGNHVSPLREALVWPLKGPVELSVALVVLAALAAGLLPNNVIGASPELPWWGAHRALAMLWTSMVFASFTVFAWFTFFGKFSREAWRDPRFN